MKLRIPENLTRQAYRLIRDEILKGQLDDHRHLTEGYFATRYGISKSPIREALNLLESEGLITIVPRRGAYVAEFSIHDIEEIYEIREVLEALVIRNAVLDSTVLGRMRRAVQAAETARTRGDKLAYMQEDAAFHMGLAQASSNSRLRKMLENMRNQMFLLRRQTFELSSGTSVKQHFQILAALEKGNRATAAKLMVEHIQTVRASLVQHIREQEGHSSPKGDLRTRVKSTS